MKTFNINKCYKTIFFSKRIYNILILLSILMLFPIQANAQGIKSLNSYIPGSPSEKLDVKLELRYRFESRDNFDFNDSNDDKDDFHLFRSRLVINYDPIENLHAFVQLQDARIFESEFANKTGFEDNVDIRQAYLDIKNSPEGLLTLRIGRQELSYGNQRLVGGFNWSNVAQSFDAIKLMYDSERYKVDFFASKKVINDSDGFNRWDWEDDDDFLGAYGTYKALEKHTVDLYYFYRGNEPADLKESTLGIRLVGKPFNGVDYGLEAARQFGDRGSKDIESSAIVALAGYTFNTQWTPRVGIEWDFASGDKDPADNEHNTFANLFPTNHIHYGFMDRASLQNLNNIRLTATVKPDKKLSVQVDAHLIKLDKTTDSLYHAGRKAIRTAADSDVSNSVGTNVDLLVKYNLNTNFKFLAGYSQFLAGDFLKETGSSDDGSFYYFQTIFSF